TIGENSIIGAGAIVVSSIPANCVAVGNPARVIKELDPNETFTIRAHAYADPGRLAREFIRWEQQIPRTCDPEGHGRIFFIVRVSFGHPFAQLSIAGNLATEVR
ncbi:MAG: hypothetical protein WAU91_11225, partial [Desulfatitalea sp.]